MTHRFFSTIMDVMPQQSAVIALAVHEQLCHVTTLQLIQAFSLISCLKRDIQLPQPLSENPGCAPTVLPPAISDFLSDSISLPPELMHEFWTIIKDDAWNAPVKEEPTEEDEECFRQYGWQRELSAFKFLITIVH
jgi:hypothetical protein